jgi:DNA-binding NtrC family response regulator
VRAAHILIVDDDPALLEALPETLRLHMKGIEIDTCDSAAAALERIEASDYDAIVTDIKMPGVDGLALLSRIKDRRPATPTLLITGHGQHDLAVQALRGGAHDYITKPIDRDSFIASLERAIRMRQRQRRVDSRGSGGGGNSASPARHRRQASGGGISTFCWFVPFSEAGGCGA